MFDDISITRSLPNNTETGLIKVPITYSPKDKMIARVLQDPDIERKTETPTLPIMSFEMVSFKYDSDRKIGTTNRIAFKEDANTFKYVYTPVAYDIGFKLYIFVKNTEDGLKIIEEILPYFTPDFTVKVKLLPDMQEIKSIPVVLNNVSMEDNYEGKIEKRRDIIWTLDFTVKGYIYGPKFTSPIIKYANVSFYAYPPSLNNTNNYSGSIITTPGLTTNNEPTSNANLSIPTNEIEVTDDFGFITQKIYG